MGDKSALIKYRDMLTIVRDRVKILKDAGKSADETVAAKPRQIWTPPGAMGS